MEDPTMWFALSSWWVVLVFLIGLPSLLAEKKDDECCKCGSIDSVKRNGFRDGYYCEIIRCRSCHKEQKVTVYSNTRY